MKGPDEMIQLEKTGTVLVPAGPVAPWGQQGYGAVVHCCCPWLETQHPVSRNSLNHKRQEKWVAKGCHFGIISIINALISKHCMLWSLNCMSWNALCCHGFFKLTIKTIKSHQSFLSFCCFFATLVSVTSQIYESQEDVWDFLKNKSSFLNRLIQGFGGCCWFFSKQFQL